MKAKLLGILLTTLVVLLALLGAGGLWYYTIGRKPKLAVSTKITAKLGSPSAHLIAPGEVLLFAAGKASLYEMSTGKEKWSANLNSSKSSPAPIVQATVAPTPVSKNATHSKANVTDEMLQARLDRRMAKLRTWAAQLDAKRNNLNTPLKVAAFKEEEAKYQAEAAEAQAEAASLHKSSAVAAPAVGYASEFTNSQLEEDSSGYEQKEVFCIGPAIWVAQGQTVRMLDRTNGRLVKEMGLPGKVQKLVPGPGCLYVAAAGQGGQQVTRINTADGAAKAIQVSGAIAAPPFEWSGAGLPPSPTVQPQCTQFSASGAELAQLDSRLTEKKITERQAMKGDSVSDWENADKNTVGGWANDAAVIAQTMANDAQREATGGKELVDDSTYEVVLRRPFNPGIPDASALQVHGRPNLFSTSSFDLVVAGQTLIVFDHNNKKLWESKLAFPAPAPSFGDEHSAGGTAMIATTSHPFLEDNQHLYFFDKGFLTAFDRQTGATHWRLPSVGIQKVQIDRGDFLDRGPVLYVVSANGKPETLQYSQQAVMPTVPIIFKIDAASGKILWKQEKYQDCFVSGGNVYATLETRNAEDLVNSVFERGKAIQTRFKLYKLSARNGHAQWEWFQTRSPLRIEADNKQVSLLFPDELQVLTSRAL